MTTRTANDPLRQAQKICATLRAAGPQVVFFNGLGKLEVCAANGPRHRSLQQQKTFLDRCAGVFDADASPELIAACIREVWNV